MVSETTHSDTAKNVTHAFPFWVWPICVKMEIFFVPTAPLEYKLFTSPKTLR